MQQYRAKACRSFSRAAVAKLLSMPSLNCRCGISLDVWDQIEGVGLDSKFVLLLFQGGCRDTAIYALSELKVWDQFRGVGLDQKCGVGLAGRVVAFLVWLSRYCCLRHLRVAGVGLVQRCGIRLEVWGQITKFVLLLLEGGCRDTAVYALSELQVGFVQSFRIRLEVWGQIRSFCYCCLRMAVAILLTTPLLHCRCGFGFARYKAQPFFQKCIYLYLYTSVYIYIYMQIGLARYKAQPFFQKYMYIHICIQKCTYLHTYVDWISETQGSAILLDTTSTILVEQYI